MDNNERRIMSRWIWIAVLLIWLSHAALNIQYLARTDAPPYYDCGYHLQLSLEFYDRFKDWMHWDYPARLLHSSGYYPPLVYAVTTPFYLLFGISEDSAVFANQAFLLLLL